MEANKEGIILKLQIVQTLPPPQGLGSEPQKGPVEGTHTYFLPRLEIQSERELDQAIEKVFSGARRKN